MSLTHQLPRPIYLSKVASPLPRFEATRKLYIAGNPADPAESENDHVDEARF
jgi:hypothetical protein